MISLNCQMLTEHWVYKTLCSIQDFYQVNICIMLYGRFVPGISRASSVTSQPLDCIILPYGWQPPQPCPESPRSLPGTCHTELTVETGEGKRGRKRGRLDQKTPQSFNQNISGAAMLEQT